MVCVVVGADARTRVEERLVDAHREVDFTQTVGGWWMLSGHLEAPDSSQ